MATTTGSETGLPAGTTGFGPDYSVTAPPVTNPQVAPPAPTNSIVATAGPATTQFNNYSSTLATLLSQLGNYQTNPQNSNSSTANTATLANTTNDPYIQALNEAGATSDAATKALISSIQANNSSQVQSLSNSTQNYERGLQGLGIQRGTAQSTPDLLAGQIQNQNNIYATKLQSLNTAMTKSIMDAQSAQAKNDLSTLSDKMNYIDKLNTQRQSVLKNIADQMTASATIADDTIAGVYSQLKTLDPADQETYLVQVSNQYGIPLTSLVTALNKAQTTAQTAAYTALNQKLSIQEKEDTIAKAATAADKGAYAFSATQKAGLIGTGLTEADITGLENDINTEGIAAALGSGSGLTPAQITALSTIFGYTPPSAADSSGNVFTDIGNWFKKTF